MEDKREARRKRRQRNQAVAYIVLFCLLAVVAIGIVQGTRIMTQNQQEEESVHESNQEIIENLYASEENITPPTPTPEPTPEPPTAEELMEEKIEDLLANMSLTEKVAGLFIVTPEAITGVNTAVAASDGTKKALEEYPVGGIIYMKKNIKSAEQLTEMIENTKSYSKYPLFIAVDEEGGTVSRVASAGLAPLQPSAAEIGSGGPTEAYQAMQAGIEIGGYLSEFGFNLNFAPVADISNVENSIMKDRAYGSDAATVDAFVRNMMGGLEERNVTACVKHFPGIGSTTADTHNGLVSIDRTAQEMRTEELTVFQSAIDAGARMIMVGHASVEALAGDKMPSSLSQVIVTDILRNELGFQGVIITDALNMSAISQYYASEQAAVMALKAGCDMVLMPEDFAQAYAGVVNAVNEGTISEERINDSLRRIYRIKYAEEFLTEAD